MEQEEERSCRDANKAGQKEKKNPKTNKPPPTKKPLNMQKYKKGLKGFRKRETQWIVTEKGTREEEERKRCQFHAGTVGLPASELLQRML